MMALNRTISFVEKADTFSPEDGESMFDETLHTSLHGVTTIIFISVRTLNFFCVLSARNCLEETCYMKPVSCNRFPLCMTRLKVVKAV
jgi:hypothetical protein